MLYISCALVVMYFVPFGPDLCDGHGIHTQTTASERASERKRESLANVTHVFREFLVSLNYTKPKLNSTACVENALHALREFSVSPVLVAAVVGNCLSIASFNFFGMSVTQ